MSSHLAPRAAVLSRHMDDFELRLVQNSYDGCAIVDLLDGKSGKGRQLMRSTLEAGRARDLTDQMIVGGLLV